MAGRTRGGRAAGRGGTGAALGPNSYGKSRVRMVKVSRAGRRHGIHEVTVDIALEGDFGAVHTQGDNRLCLPTDTMKNTVYALGKDHAMDSIEAFALDLGAHFVARNPQVKAADVRVASSRWDRATVRGREHPHCFLQGPGERQTCQVRTDRRGSTVRSGLEGLVILKSTDSAFRGYLKDEFTTLAETDDRIMATSVTARWTYAGEGPGRRAYPRCREAIRRALIETFADHASESVQHTLYAMGEAALGACSEMTAITLTLPNRHCLLVNLEPFGMENRNEVFLPIDEPFGLIEAEVRRGRKGTRRRR